ncbi:MAG: hypothetical protein ACXWL2_03610 [Candidatus Chromulinivorax sp.]
MKLTSSMNTKKNKYLLISIFLCVQNSLLNAAPLGFLEPYDFMIEAEPITQKAKWQWNFLTQTCFNTTAFDEEGNVVNALQIYEPEQNFIGMFQGLGTQSQFNQLINSIAAGSGGGVNTLQNGLFTPTGTFSGYQVAFLSSYKFHTNCYFKIALPVYNIQLSNVTWTYAGDDQTFSGQQLESELISSFTNDALTFFDLSLNGWKASGLGDLAMLLDYIGDYPQGRSVLRNVRVHVRAGLTFPTGLKADENLIMSQPFGFDGSVSLPFGGGLDINLGRYFQCGFRGQFNYIWGNQKERRVPTFVNQTTLLYPQVLPTFKSYGITQTFNLYGQIYNPIGGLSFKVAYEYYFKSLDRISVLAGGYDSALMNADLVLEEVTRHNMIYELSFDSAFLSKMDRTHPQFGLFVNMPFNGSLGVLASTVGAQLTLEW